VITLRAVNVQFGYLARPILRGVNCELQHDQVYGLIGANGSGKSTMLKLLLGEFMPDGGMIQRDKALKCAYLTQEVTLALEESAFESVLEGAEEVSALEHKLKAIEAQFSDPAILASEKRLGRLIDEQQHALEEYTRLGGPGMEGHVLSLLRSLGFREEEMHLPVGKLSGGQKKLIGIARLMIGRPDVLLLDEPDNHLDLGSKVLLERLIRTFNGTVVIVSHDRYFLDLVADSILELEAGKLTQFEGSYSEYIFDKQLKKARQAQLYQAQQHEITRLEQSAKRLLTWGDVFDNPKFIKRGQSMLKRLEKIDRIEKPVDEAKRLEINMGGWSGSRRVLRVQGAAKGFGAARAYTQTLNNIDLEIWHGERVGLIGPNGVGKSLLVKMVLGEIPLDAGEIELGPSVRLAYYSQEFETLDPALTLIDTVGRAGNFNESRSVAFLRKFGFDYAQRDTRVGALSGGERARLQIALMTLSGANFLIMDEPTNHLDIPSSEFLEEALLDFEGSILAVSHDRYFLDRIATRIVELSACRATSFKGNYSDFVQKNSTLGAVY